MNLITPMTTMLLLASFSYSAQAGAPLKPDVINFDVPLAEARQQLPAHCDTISEQVIAPAQIPGTKDRQIQLDCEGFSFKGLPRKAEFVYRDGELILVWILTTAEEEADIEAWMRSSAEPSHVSSQFTAFTSKNMALRKVPHEVLFYSEAAAPMFNAWFASAASE